MKGCQSDPYHDGYKGQVHLDRKKLLTAIERINLRKYSQEVCACDVETILTGVPRTGEDFLSLWDKMDYS